MGPIMSYSHCDGDSASDFKLTDVADEDMVATMMQDTITRLTWQPICCHADLRNENWSRKKAKACAKSTIRLMSTVTASLQFLSHFRSNTGSGVTESVRSYPAVHTCRAESDEGLDVFAYQRQLVLRQWKLPDDVLDEVIGRHGSQVPLQLPQDHQLPLLQDRGRLST